MNIDLNNYIRQHLADIDRRVRDLQQVLMLAGGESALEQRLQRAREAVEDAIDHSSIPTAGLEIFIGASLNRV